MQDNDVVFVTGKRVSLIAPARSYMEEFINKSISSEELHRNWVQSLNNKEAYLAYLERINKDNQFGTFIKLKKTNDLIGVVNVNEIVKGTFKSGYLGFYLFSGFEKQGLMNEALKLVINYAFDSMQLHRLEANIQPDNINSLRLVHRVGFIKEGFSRKYLYINNKWQDHIRYALTKEVLIAQKTECITPTTMKDNATHDLGVGSTLPDCRSILEELKQREPIFHRREYGTSSEALENMTTTSFWEVGASGKRYDRDDVIKRLLARYAMQSIDEYETENWATKDFCCQKVTTDNYLLTYTLIQGTRITRRATIWQRENEIWKIAYHQGTIVEETS